MKRTASMQTTKSRRKPVGNAYARTHAQAVGQHENIRPIYRIDGDTKNSRMFKNCLDPGACSSVSGVPFKCTTMSNLSIARGCRNDEA